MKWLKSFLRNGKEVWFPLHSHSHSLVFNKLGGIEFLLKCDFEISKLPVELSTFHHQVLSHQKMIYKHNFNHHNVPPWNNRVILRKRKSIFMEDWMKKYEIWSIVHLMDGNGNILKLVEFNNTYNSDCSIKNYIKTKHSKSTYSVN